MKSEELVQVAVDALKADPDLARRHTEMRTILEHAQTIGDIVRAYRVGCIPPTAHQGQIFETEQAQFAACHMLLQMFMARADQGEEVVHQWITAIQQECATYAARRFTMVNAPQSTAH